jgi:Protein of unknown function (DUF2971)
MQYLYHYTGTRGLLGILKKREFWATDGNFLNDTMEGSIPHNILKAISSRNRIITQPESFVRQWLQLKNADCPRSRFFVVCFCRDPDLLSQWRGYTKGYTGYALGFSRDVLRERISCMGEVTIQECGYYARTDWLQLQSRLDACVQSVRTEIKRVKDEEAPHPESAKDMLDLFELSAGQKAVAEALLTDFWLRDMQPLFDQRAHLKPPSFSEEKEERIIVTGECEIHYRETKNALIPFIKLNLNDVLCNDGLREIVVGPSSNPDRAIRGVKQYLNDNSLCHVEVRSTASTLTFDQD